MLARTTPAVTEPGARQKARLARQRVLDQLQEELSRVSDAMGRVPLTALMPLVAKTLDQRYERGYTAGLLTGRRPSRMLRLTLSQDSLKQFLGTRFGKAFMNGQLSPDALANFKFGGRP